MRRIYRRIREIYLRWRMVRELNDLFDESMARGIMEFLERDSNG